MNRLMATTYLMATAVLLATLLSGSKAFADLPDDTTVYYGGGTRGHVEGCRRLTEKNPAHKMTLAEMEAKGGQLCSRCPGSELNKQREEAAKKASPPAPAGSETRKNTGPAVEYDPMTKVYVDALWFRVHAENCPALILKDQKKTMTLAEADEAGARIGESGQSGRDNCCFVGYQRKHPEKTFTDETLLCGDDRKDRVKHVAGCHRYWPDRTHLRRPMKEWLAGGFTVCPHCIERGPSLATVSDEEWSKLPAPGGFIAPEGWVPKPYSTDRSPPKEEIELLIQETLSNGNGIQELQFTNPVATAENFTTMRFFFPVGQWLDLYKAYRATGDQRLLDKLLESARHYQQLSVAYPSVAQVKAGDPEGMPFMYSMAACARITLQSARKHPAKVNKQELDEAETFLMTMLSVLKPTCEGDDSLDDEMGIPKRLADDFRTRAFNRSMNGIGTLAMMTAALEDLQAIEKTTAYQPAIDRYRKVVHEYVKYWFSIGHLCTEIEGQSMFVYPYKPEPKPRTVDGCKIYKRTEDGGHYSHTLQGLMCIYEATPEVGIDDQFMTAVANTVHYCRTHPIKVRGKEEYSGHFQCPTAMRVSPQGGESVEGHAFDRGTGGTRFHLLEAFKDGVIDALAIIATEDQKAAARSSHEERLVTLHVQYMKALRKDRNLVHLGETR